MNRSPQLPEASVLAWAAAKQAANCEEEPIRKLAIYSRASAKAFRITALCRRFV